MVTTTASPRQRLNAIAGPILGELLLGMTVAMVGLWLAAQTSDAAAGAFGIANQVLETVWVLFRVLAIGVGVVITQSLGAGQRSTAQRTAIAVLGAATWVGVLAMISVFFGNGLTLELLHTPDAVRPLAGPFLALLAPTLLLDAYNLSMAAVLRAHLHVRDSLHVMFTMHATHLLLATVLMRGVGPWDGWGVNGYAVAMLVSRMVGLALHLWLWRQRMQLAARSRDWWALSLPTLAPVIRIGTLGATTEFAYRMGFMLSLAATATLGVSALATHSYTLQLLRYVLLVSLAIGWACELMVGRLVGAGDFRAASGLVRKSIRNGLLASGGLAVLAALLAPWLMQAFTRDPAIIAAAQVLLWLSLLLETGRVFNLVLNGALRATGDAVFPAVTNAASMTLVLGIGSVSLGGMLGLQGIWLAYVLDEWLRGIAMLVRWTRHGWLAHARDTQRRLRAIADPMGLEIDADGAGRR